MQIIGNAVADARQHDVGAEVRPNSAGVSRRLHNIGPATATGPIHPQLISLGSGRENAEGGGVGSRVRAGQEFCVVTLAVTVGVRLGDGGGIVSTAKVSTN